MKSIATIDLLSPSDDHALQFCADYLCRAWEIPLAEARERLTNYAHGKENACCVLAKIDGRPAGMMVLFPRTRFRTDGVYEPWTAGLYVDERFRNCGIGTAILNRLIDEARIRGFSKIHLGTDKDHLKEWYSRLGWRPIGKAFDEEHEYQVFVYTLDT